MNLSQLADNYLKLCPEKGPKLSYDIKFGTSDVGIRFTWDDDGYRAGFRSNRIGSVSVNSLGLITGLQPNLDGPYDLVDRLVQAYATAPKDD